MFLESNEIITEHQLSFRRQFSCKTAIQTVIDEWKLIVNEKKWVIFCGSRAFETIDRGRLLKNYQYRIRGNVLE